jgi:predicted glycosyltransferase
MQGPEMPNLSVCEAALTDKRPKLLRGLLDVFVQQDIEACQAFVQFLIVDNDPEGSARRVVEAFQEDFPGTRILLATRVVVPRCYRGWTPKRKTMRYPGYHELAYLHPKYFSPSREVALGCGLSSEGDTFLIRLVSWKASHDLGKRGWSRVLLESIVQRLRTQGKVIISSEGELPSALENLRFEGPAQDIHHLLAYCRAYVGESPTMASEAAILGVPAVYVASASLGYVEDQEQRYGMVRFVKPDSIKDTLDALDDVTSTPAHEFERRRRSMLNESIDVPRFVTDILLDFDTSKPN